jgi:hypothetical protein
MENIEEFVTTPGEGKLKVVYYLREERGIVVKSESGDYYIVSTNEEDLTLIFVKVTEDIKITRSKFAGSLIRNLLYNYCRLTEIRDSIESGDGNLYPFGVSFIDDVLSIIRENLSEEESLQILNSDRDEIKSVISKIVENLNKKIEADKSKGNYYTFNDRDKDIENIDYLGNLKFVFVSGKTFLVTNYGRNYALFNHAYGNDLVNVGLMSPEDYISRGLDSESHTLHDISHEKDMVKRFESESFSRMKIEVDGDLIYTDKEDSDLMEVLRNTVKNRFGSKSFEQVDEGITDVDDNRGESNPLETKVGDKLKILKFKDNGYDITGVLMYDNWSDRYILFGQDLKMDRATFIVMDDELIKKLVEVPSDDLAITRIKRFYSDFVDFPEKRYCDNVKDEDYRTTNNTLYKIRSILRADGRFSDEEIYR